jgi:PAS domain S-box-containing protein
MAGALLEELFDRAPVGVAVLDRELRYLYVNEALAKLNGVPVEEHLGQAIEDVLPDLAAQARDAFEAVLRSEQPLRDWELTGETAASRGEERHWLENVYPLRAAGEVVGLGAVVVDITDRRRAERKLEGQRERAQRLLAQLERGLTPRAPQPRHWRCAWRYVAASEEMLLGGDFLGFIERPDGSLTFVIGDVAGRGPAAAAVGAALRAGWRSLVEAGVPLGDRLPALARLLAAYRDDASMFATLCCGRLSGTQPRLEIASAGHHPPLLVSASGNSAIEHEIGPALGISRVEPRWEVTSIDIEPEAALVLFTDGVFEGRTRSGRRLGYERLAELMPPELATGDAEKRLDQLLSRLMSANRGPLEDDVALMLLSAARHPSSATP